MKRILFLLFLLAPVFGNAQIITTVAGNGIPGYSGDNGSATAAMLKYPSFIVFDANDNFYFAERLNNVIRKVSATGIISTVAGNGTSGYSGDGGPATLAQLNEPVAVAIDNVGNIYISDEGNNRIRKIDAVTNKISTVVGNAINGYSGDGGPATLASINYPIGIACDFAGNLYISDHLNFRIRKVSTSGIISTYAGNGTNAFSGDGNLATNAGMNAPNGLACDRSGNLYIAENRIRKVDISTHIIATIAGNGAFGFSGDGGPATAATLWLPLTVTVDVFQNIYISDQDNNRVRQVNANGIIHTIAGNGIAGYSGDGNIATTAQIYYPEGVAFDSCGNLYLVDEANCRIRKVTFPNCKYLDVKDTREQNSLNIYPNPTNDLLNIENIKSPTIYHLVSIVGSVLQQGTLNQGANNISIQSLSPGVYMLELIPRSSGAGQGEVKTVRKIIKQK